jgi:transposase InsO family protein
MELRNKEDLRSEILQSWLRSAWVYPFQGPDERTYLRLTPGGRLKMRRRIGELERVLGVEGTELARQEQAGTLPVERDRLELAMMVQAYDTERRLMQSQGAILGTPAVTLEEQGEEDGPDKTP